MIFNLSKTALYGSTTLALSAVLSSTAALAATSGCVSGDCTGYTKTAAQCSGKPSIRCPFDTSKYFCDDGTSTTPPATEDCSGYIYSCTGSNEKPYGDSCNGKYKICRCAEGGWVNGSCVAVEVDFCVQMNYCSGTCYSYSVPNIEAYILHGSQQQQVNVTPPSYWGDGSCVTVKVDPTEPVKLVYDVSKAAGGSSGYGSVYALVEHTNFVSAKCASSSLAGESVRSSAEFTVYPGNTFYSLIVMYDYDTRNYSQAYTTASQSSGSGYCSVDWR